MCLLLRSIWLFYHKYLTASAAKMIVPLAVSPNSNQDFWSSDSEWPGLCSLSWINLLSVLILAAQSALGIVMVFCNLLPLKNDETIGTFKNTKTFPSQDYKMCPMTQSCTWGQFAGIVLCSEMHLCWQRRAF